VSVPPDEQPTTPSLPATAPAPLSGVDAIVAELKGLRGDFHLLASRLEAAEETTAKAIGLANAAAAAASQAYDQATAAMRATSEIKQEVSDTKTAMIRHADTVSAATQAIVRSNQEQNPTIDATLAILMKVKKNAPAIIATGTVLASVLATIAAAFVNAYLHARGH
jgi:hypothetical protein